MANDPSSDNLPLADVLRGANALVAAGLIEDWALGGALAAIYHVEPCVTYDADIFFVPKDKARIEQLLQQADLDKSYLENLLQRHRLRLPAP